ncbi:MAG: type III secretion system export apparatus subunit SctT [Desulfovibrio sp.]|jgi:type III secretion protein T|nr:type III secretion system export apparatus subunit SctT [Desulfovibrio sp.]
MFDLFHSLPEQGLIFFTGCVRPLTFFFLVPFLGGDAVPGQLRVSLAFLLALFAYPLFAGLSPPDSGTALALWLLCVLGKEILAGFMQAYAASVVFWAMLSAGFIMDNQRGAGMAQATDPASGESSSLFGGFLHEIAIYILFSSGAFLHILLFLLAGYAVCPPGFEMGAEARNVLPFFLMGQFSRLMVMSVLFAAPIMLICLLSDLSLGLVNRFAPQLNVFFLSMPIKSALGLFMILLYLGTLLPLVTRELFSIGGHMDAVWNAVR